MNGKAMIVVDSTLESFTINVVLSHVYIPTILFGLLLINILFYILFAVLSSVSGLQATEKKLSDGKSCLHFRFLV